MKLLILVLLVLGISKSFNFTSMDIESFEEEDIDETVSAFDKIKRNLGVCVHKNEKFLKNYNPNQSDYVPSQALVVKENPNTEEIYVGYI